MLSVFSLFSCGGGSSSGTPTTPTPPPNPPNQTSSVDPLYVQNGIQFYGEESGAIGKTLGFAVISDNDDIDNIHWQQTSGPNLSILAENSPSIGLTPNQAGDYTIVANIEKDNGQSETLEANFSIDAQADISIMLDHTVTELGKVSLHLSNRTNSQISSIAWEQVAGPNIGELNQDRQFIFFDAPEVNKDELIQLNASVSFSSGNQASESVYVLVKNTDILRDGLFFDIADAVVSEDMHAYNSDSRYKNALERCVYSNQIPSIPNCNFSSLPLIGMVTPTPEIQDILDRTLVSHKWMGERFKAYLENSLAGPDMLNLLRGVTAIVISYDVRPSFYWAATGAIYLDARNFWVSPEERDSLNDQADFRSDFGNALQFNFPWRYVKNNAYYPLSSYRIKDERQSRSFEDLEASISWLMYHELAHANDFFPSTAWASIEQNNTPLEYFRNNGANSDILVDRFPLRSNEMHALAKVRFGGEDPSATQRAYSPSDVQSFFEPDIASSFYSFFTEREDYATLFERFIMLYRLGASADVAITDDSEDFSITWGQRDRISDPSIANRVEFVVSRVYPELANPRGLINNLPEEQTLPVGADWVSSVDLSSNTNSLAEKSPESSLSKAEKEYRKRMDIRPPHLDISMPISK